MSGGNGLVIRDKAHLSGENRPGYQIHLQYSPIHPTRPVWHGLSTQTIHEVRILSSSLETGLFSLQNKDTLSYKQYSGTRVQEWCRLYHPYERAKVATGKMPFLRALRPRDLFRVLRKTRISRPRSRQFHRLPQCIRRSTGS